MDDKRIPAAGGVGGEGGGGQAKITMSRQGRGLRGRMDGQAGISHPAAELHDGLLVILKYDTYARAQ